MNCVFDEEFSPLKTAAEYNNLDLVEFLVANGADINQKFGEINLIYFLLMVRNVNNNKLYCYFSIMIRVFCCVNYLNSHRIFEGRRFSYHQVLVRERCKIVASRQFI